MVYLYMKKNKKSHSIEERKQKRAEKNQYLPRDKETMVFTRDDKSNSSSEVHWRTRNKSWNKGDND